MKKFMMFAAVCAAVLSFASCSGKQANTTTTPEEVTVAVDKVVAYTGVMPAADCDGIRYDLKLQYDAEDNYAEGDYNLVETYFTGNEDGTTFRSEGDFKVISKDGKSYIMLEPETTANSEGASTQPTYFLIGQDESLVMVNADFEEPTAVADYTLTVVK